MMAQPEYFDRVPYSDKEQAWASDEYDAGYRARLRDGAEYHTATYCWRTGWQEADRDLQLGTAMPAGDCDDVVEVTWSDFGTGQDARVCELPFDESQVEAWKRSWVQADIAIGLPRRC
jgi:hypothetical protein